VTNSTFDWRSSIRIHECCSAVPARDMGHLIRCWSKVYSVTAGTPNTCSPACVH
jgi:hypothetical protein